MKSITIELPGVKAVSRNQTTGHFYKYHKELATAEQYVWLCGKVCEYHFEKRVDIKITAYYDTRGNKKCADPSNIDDKIFVDALIRWKKQGGSRKKKELGLSKALEKPVWFIEDDDHRYIRYVTKEAIPGTEYKVIINITEIE